ncbi:MAG: type II secretion system F family protein [bacterium]|nr:type II secretion system F family protein [bacterium]
MGIDISEYKKRSISTGKNNLDFLNRDFNFKYNFSDKNKERFYRELTVLIEAGIDFKKSLDILCSHFNKKADVDLIIKIKNDVIQGASFYEALKNTHKFSPYEYFSVQIGEETRRLPEILLELQKYFDRKIKMKRQLVSVFTYPAFVLLVTFAVLYFMMSNVVPMFASVFKQFGAELPAITQNIITLSEMFPVISIIIFIFFGLIFMGHMYLKKNKNYRSLIARLLIRVPFFGELIRKIFISRMCQSLNLLLSAKTPLIKSLELTSKMIAFYPIESSLEMIKKDIMKGSSFGDSLKKFTIYDHKMTSMVIVGEEINQLDTMFEKLSQQYNEEIEHKTKMIGVVLEPMIIIIIGVIVGVIMIAMYSPMFDLSKIIQ